MLRWLEPENGEETGPAEDRRLVKQIREKVKKDGLYSQIEAIAKSRTAGIWRIKRAKIILGSVEGKTVQKMVTDVRVPPNSIIKCQKLFIKRGIDYFKTPDRSPTSREANVESLLLFLESPPSKRSPRWHTTSVRYIGHDFSASKILRIRELIASMPNANPTEFARQICQLFNLCQANGKYKISQTRDIMKRMDMDNVIALPQVRRRPNSKRRARKTATRIMKDTFSTQMVPDLGIDDIRHLQFIPVYSEKDSLIWREMIERFHYIKSTRLFGAQMRYLVYGDSALPSTVNFFKSTNGMAREHWAKCYNEVKRGKHLLAALGFAAASWRLSSREAFVGWTDAQRESNLNLVVNNVRFLILPWNRIKNLASKILGGICRQLPIDWEARYACRPVLMETFVNLDRFKGTCYKAANWISIGTTEGYSLVSEYRKRASPKGIFVYPLCRDFREQLCRF